MHGIRSQIIFYMETTGIGYADIAERQGVSRQMIFKSLNGDTNMRITTAQKLAKDIGAEIMIVDKDGNEAVPSSQTYLQEITENNIHITIEDLQLILKPFELDVTLKPDDE